ncbi:MAG: hypothetical protein LBR06_03560 [Bacteroidales bacterium]|jgi:hypothetical protein|nr:hypothetical protein [Bacteroidales bacterium]
MKKAVFLTLVVISGLLLGGCSDDFVGVESVSLEITGGNGNGFTRELPVGGEITLRVKFMPANATIDKYNYKWHLTTNSPELYSKYVTQEVSKSADELILTGVSPGSLSVWFEYGETDETSPLYDTEANLRSETVSLTVVPN